MDSDVEGELKKSNKLTIIAMHCYSSSYLLFARRQRPTDALINTHLLKIRIDELYLVFAILLVQVINPIHFDELQADFLVLVLQLLDLALDETTMIQLNNRHL